MLKLKYRPIVLCASESYPEFTAELKDKKEVQAVGSSNTQKPDNGEGKKNYRPSIDC